MNVRFLSCAKLQAAAMHKVVEERLVEALDRADGARRLSSIATCLALPISLASSVAALRWTRRLILLDESF